MMCMACLASGSAHVCGNRVAASPPLLPRWGEVVVWHRFAPIQLSSPGLLHPHVPFHQAAHLALGIAARHHAVEELAMLLLGLTVLLGAERDDRQQILDLGEHPLLDHLADLLVAAPGRVLSAVVCA